MRKYHTLNSIRHNVFSFKLAKWKKKKQERTFEKECTKRDSTVTDNKNRHKGRKMEMNATTSSADADAASAASVGIEIRTKSIFRLYMRLCNAHSAHLSLTHIHTYLGESIGKKTSERMACLCEHCQHPKIDCKYFSPCFDY